VLRRGAKRYGSGHRTGDARRGGAAILALRGDLGAGKTTFVQGFFRGLGLRRRAPSPTFIIMRRHALGARRPPAARARRGISRRPQFSNVFHVDAYRLKGAKPLAALGFKGVLSDPRNIVLIEWADRVRGIVPKGALWLAFGHGKNAAERSILIARK